MFRSEQQLSVQIFQCEPGTTVGITQSAPKKKIRRLLVLSMNNKLLSSWINYTSESKKLRQAPTRSSSRPSGCSPNRMEPAAAPRSVRHAQMVHSHVQEMILLQNCSRENMILLGYTWLHMVTLYTVYRSPRMLVQKELIWPLGFQKGPIER